MHMSDSTEMILFVDVLKSLADVNTPFPVRFLRSFSDLTPKNLKDFAAVWKSIPPKRKVNLLEDLETVLDNDTLVNFDELGRFLLTDQIPAVRVLAVRLLWDCGSPAIIPDLVRIFAQDSEESARATAADLFGKFILLGELDALSIDHKDLITSHLLNALQGTETSFVKQRSLESLGFSSHPAVHELIQQASQSTDPAWVSAALCAMGRSADETWAPQVEEMLTSPDPEVQFEAIRAAGELELGSAREQLFRLLDDGIEDEEIRLAAIWSLSQIGGDDVKEKLNELIENAASESEIEWIENAIENLDLAASGALEMFDYSSDEDDDLDDEEGDDIEEDDDDVYLDEEDDEEDA